MLSTQAKAKPNSLEEKKLKAMEWREEKIARAWSMFIACFDVCLSPHKKKLFTHLLLSVNYINFHLANVRIGNKIMCLGYGA